MYEKHERATGFDERLEADPQGRTLMTPELARRISELRACENFDEVRVVTLDERENRALVLIVPRACPGALTDSGWEATDSAGHDVDRRGAPWRTYVTLSGRAASLVSRHSMGFLSST